MSEVKSSLPSIVLEYRELFVVGEAVVGERKEMLLREGTRAEI